MKLVITGALGHIGSYLIRRLPQLASCDKVIMVDNFLTQRYCSLYDLDPQYPLQLLTLDVAQEDLPAGLLAPDDVVIHLAAITDATSSFERPDFVWRNNLEGTRRIARQVAEVGATLIFPSSTSVYGVQDQLVDEECELDALNPQSPYAECKLKEEEVIAELIQSGSRSYICRLGTIYGVSAGMRFHTAVNKFCYQASLGLPITVWRTALHQHRPYLSLDDCCEALAHLSGLKRTPELNEQPAPGLYNVLSGNHTVQDIVNVIKKSIPKLEVKFVDVEIMNQLSYKVSSQKLTSTGFNFSGDLEDNIATTIRLLRGVTHV